MSSLGLLIGLFCAHRLFLEHAGDVCVSMLCVSTQKMALRHGITLKRGYLLALPGGSIHARPLLQRDACLRQTA